MEFENHFLRAHRDYLLSELQSADDATRRTTLAMLERTPCDAAEVRRSILYLRRQKVQWGEDTMPFFVVPGTSAQPDEDRELATAMAQAAQALEEAGMSAQDLLDELPAPGEEVNDAHWGAALANRAGLRDAQAGTFLDYLSALRR